MGLGEGALLSRMEAVGAELARNHEQLSRGETRFSGALHFAQRGPLLAELTDFHLATRGDGFAGDCSCSGFGLGAASGGGAGLARSSSDFRRKHSS